MVLQMPVIHTGAPAACYLPQADQAIVIRLLGSVNICRAGRSVELRRKGRALLSYLAVTGRPHRRTSLAALFCPEANDPSAALRLLLTRIRTQLSPDAIQSTDQSVDLNHAVVWVDVAVFQRLLAKNGSEQASLDHLAAATDLYHGQLCDGCSLANAPEFDLWLAGERAHLQQQYEQALLTLLHAAEAGKQIDGAIQYARQLVQTNPLLELAHERLIQLYLRSGQRDAALAQYEQCCTILRCELGIDPGPEIQRVFELLVNGKRLPHPTAGLVMDDDLGASGFVGRNIELHHLLQLWGKARSGTGATVLIEAPAGGGKSRLLTELCRVSQAPSIGGACSELAQALPYAPWVELLEAYLSDLSDATIAGLAPVWHDYLLRLLPSLAARLGQRTPPAPPTAGGELNRLFTAVAELLFPTTNRAPLLIWLEDLHWADESSLRLFHALARRAQRYPLLLIGVLRPAEAWHMPLLQAMIDELHAHGLVRITLPPLPADAIAALSAPLWPRLPPAERDQLQAQILAATGSNPLLVVELLRELAAHAVPPHTLPLPSSVRDLVVRRMGRLAANARPVIEALAVLDNPSAIVQLSQISACTIDETAHALDTGVRLGLLHERNTTDQTRYDIAHGLLRAAILDDLSAVRRQLLHRRTATVLAAPERDRGHERSGLIG
ncbi:MAG: AAA family ATPase [Chloroflexales bacterium]|nr:AAA family ATPase [Chloroflexales bacterium]